MTDENTTEQDNLTPETFSFFDVFSGKAYPKDTVEIFMEEEAMFRLNKLLDKIHGEPDGPERDKLIDQAAALHAKVEASKMTFHITGVDDDFITGLREVADAHFEDRKKQVKTADNRLVKHLPESEQLNYVKYFNALVMSAHIEQVVDARGRVNTAPDADQVGHMISQAPTSQKEKLQRAIGALRVSSEEFEASIDADFLAKP